MSAKLINLYAPAPRTERGKPIFIGGGHIKNVKKIIYCVGKAVIIRDLVNPLECWTYNEHKSDTSVARLSPSGYYVASADNSGKVLIWDCVGDDKVIKLDKATIANIYDMAWSDDSKRLVVGGKGNEKQGEAFFTDSGASVGEISGHSAPITSVDVKQTRPYRVATGSEDFKNNWFEGPPFKYKKTNLEHTRYINCVRFAPDGSKYITVSSDKKGFFYDGKTGDKVGELSAEGAHSGSIYCASWLSDSQAVLTSSVDKTCKLWDHEGKLLQTFKFGNDMNDQQLGCLVVGDELLSINLLGTITYLDRLNPDVPKRVVLGHNKLITAIAYDQASDRIYTSDFAGYIIEWNPSTGANSTFTGPAHTNQIQKMKVLGGKLLSISFDDTIKITSLDSKEYNEGIALGSQPSGVDAAGDFIVVSAVGNIIILKGGQIVNKHAVNYVPLSIAISPDGTEIAVGGKDTKIYVYDNNDGKLAQKRILEGHRGEVTCIQYSPDGAYIGSGDSNREVLVWKGENKVVSGWVFHTARIQDLTWAPDSQHLATGSVDSAVYVWNVANPDSRVAIKLANTGGVRGVAFMNTNTLLSAGQDCCLKSWALNYQ